MSKSRLLLIVIVVALIGAFFAFDFGHYVSLEELRARQESIVAYRDRHMLEAALISARERCAVKLSEVR